MSPTERSRKWEALFSVWWPHVRDIVCAILGLYFLWNEVVVREELRTEVLGLGIALLTITGSGLAQRVLEKDNGK